MFRGPAYSRPVPYRRENEQGSRRSPRRRIAPHGERRPDTAPEKVALAPAQAGRESEGRAALPTARSPPLQLEDRPGLPSQGSIPATLGLQLALLGREVPRRVVPSNHAFPHRAHEKDRPIPAPAPGTDPQLFPGAKTDFQRGGGGLNNKAKITLRKSYGVRT